MQETEKFTFLLLEDFSLLAFASAIEPLRIANLVSDRQLYGWTLAAENGETARCSNNSITQVDQGLIPLDRNDRLFVVSGIYVQARTTEEVCGHIRGQARRGVRLGAICSGAYVLAKAGLLKGVPCAIHWEFHDGFAESFPNVPLRKSVFVADQKIVTASGGAAAADLMLHLISIKHGSDLAIEVANQMVYNSVRPDTAEQKISFQSRHGMRNEKLAQAVRLMEDNIEEPLPPPVIADTIGITVRQLERLFGRYMNCSPKKYYVDMRLQKARNLLMQTEDSITAISVACGFNSTAHFTKAFKTQFGAPPGTYRSFSYDAES
ncbi:MAG: GlxA family transcriptional regulator [Hyphomicrobiales bacterium]|nr:GlxA family transcriptional regulator [Hyphomicrobiales bacterium]MCP4998928.1 GlxA family transcriptional regulator [Hyphomicrobiales bacterium]